MNNVKTKEKTKFTIFGFTLTNIMAYLYIVY